MDLEIHDLDKESNELYSGIWVSLESLLSIPSNKILDILEELKDNFIKENKEEQVVE